jgi:hypothetical protein
LGAGEEELGECDLGEGGLNWDGNLYKEEAPWGLGRCSASRLGISVDLCFSVVEHGKSVELKEACYRLLELDGLFGSAECLEPKIQGLHLCR